MTHEDVKTLSELIEARQQIAVLTARAEKAEAELAQAVEDIYIACKHSPCNSGICVKKNCAGNIIPCEFEWRGAERGE